MTANDRLHSALARLPLIAILRGLQPLEAEAIGAALVDAGWPTIEVPLNSPSPLQSIATLATRFPQALVGAGTVVSVQQVREVRDAGGQLIVSPHFNADVVREAARLGMVCLPGVMTATEAFAALDAGASGLKLFPAEMIPPAAVKALAAVLPAGTRMLPVGGVSPASLPAYLAAGAAGFGIGSALFKPGMSAAQVHENAMNFVASCAGIIRT
ncbi:MAG: 2-dehydro-3-deoxy-6-phosphogalactonate aldolase [Ramlibacter sp.]